MSPPNELTPDQKAAHAFVCELKTRIATQTLPYQCGLGASALESLHDLFARMREIMQANPGCVKFEEVAAHALNRDLRPFTAEWHVRQERGELASRDGEDAFRDGLAKVRVKLRKLAQELDVLAVGEARPLPDTEPVMPPEALDELFAPLPFGIAGHPSGQAINPDEAAEIAARRSRRNVDRTAGLNAAGLALSGGGIRSATFGLGVVQVLAHKGLLGEFDYLSTVSGGGYTGSFLTTRLGENQPFTTVAAPRGPDTDEIKHLRQNAKFMTARSLSESWAMVVSTLAGTLMNWMVPAWVLMAVAAITMGFKSPLPEESGWPRIVAWLSVATAATGVVYFAAQKIRWKWATHSGWAHFAVVAMLAAIACGWALDKLFDWVFPTCCPGQLWLTFDDLAASWAKGGLNGSLLKLGGGAITLGSLLALFTLMGPWLRSRVGQTVMKVVATVACGLLVPLLFLALFLGLCALGRVEDLGFPIFGPENQGIWVLACAAVLLAVIVFLVLDINVTSPHRLYRDGLARTFVDKPGQTPKPIPLSDINRLGSAPYQLINAAVNLPTSDNAEMRDRKCDFFVFSKHWCGSPTVGYHRAKDWTVRGEKVDLATAMAISGAAFSTHMGLTSRPTLRALLTLVNIRLGFWIRNPRSFRRQGGSPGFVCFLREMTGIGMSENQDWLNLSDGGHIENLATYELLRRRCKFILCVDAEQDGDFTFGGLMTLIRHAQIDLGVRIEPNLSEIRPTSDGKGPALSRSHFHLCRIHYPAVDGREAGTGLLLYIKPSITGNESELIRQYRARFPDFPHQSTLDQFYDQEQFEAYRQLGVHAAETLFLPALLAANTRPKTIPEWYRALAASLLFP